MTAHINFATEHSPWANRDLWPVIKKTVNDSILSLLNLLETEFTSWLTGELATQWNLPFFITCFYSYIHLLYSSISFSRC